MKIRSIVLLALTLLPAAASAAFPVRAQLDCGGVGVDKYSVAHFVLDQQTDATGATSYSVLLGSAAHKYSSANLQCEGTQPDALACRGLWYGLANDPAFVFTSRDSVTGAIVADFTTTKLYHYQAVHIECALTDAIE